MEQGLQLQATSEPGVVAPAPPAAGDNADQCSPLPQSDEGAGSPPLKRADSAPMTNVDLSQREILAVFGCLVMGVLLVGLDASIVGTAGPSIVRDLGTYSLFPWIVSAYLLSSAAVVPIYGPP